MSAIPPGFIELTEIFTEQTTPFWALANGYNGPGGKKKVTVRIKASGITSIKDTPNKNDANSAQASISFAAMLANNDKPSTYIERDDGENLFVTETAEQVIEKMAAARKAPPSPL